jgi:hypothetical protein
VTNVGYVAVPGRGAFAHRFGGSSWQPVDTHMVDGGPALLLVLDLHDERLARLRGRGTVAELPLASYVNNSIWQEEQIYQIADDAREIRLESRTTTSTESLDPADRFPHPFPERDLLLRMMRPEEDPERVGHGVASDAFVGGDAFLRVLGAPIWLQEPLEVGCACGARMTYAASVGYEVGAGMLLERPFFIGEGALYFFLCGDCLKVAVHSQVT